MKENELEILGQYNIDVNSTRKVRGAVLCDTKQGVFLLKEINFSEKRVPVLYDVCLHIQAQGYENIDMIVKNKEGELVSVADTGTKFLLKKWFYGRECDNKKEQDILGGVQNLALLHRILKKPEDSEIVSTRLKEEGDIVAIRLKEDLQGEFQRHNREMKKVRTFIRNRVRKGEFESVYLKYFDVMYEWAEAASVRLESSEYQELLQESKREGAIVHGDYNYHNVLILPSGIATTNFERFHYGIQLEDFYYFLRKTMEKNQWNVNLGHKLIECYNRVHPLSEAELSYLAVCIAYPEKFWKVANSYSRSRKVWISEKSIEKLNLAIKQTEEKKEFLKTIFSFYL